MILGIIIFGFILRIAYTIYWITSPDRKFDDTIVVKPTKKEALKFYLIPFYWIIVVKNYLFTEVFKE